MSPAQRSPGEMVSLGERMGYLQALRAVLALVVLASAIVAEKVVGAGLDELLPVTVGYLVLSATGEGLRRAGRMRGLLAVGGMLLVDGLFLAWVLYLTGGTQSPLRFLVYVHLIAVTLIASYRTGLKVALWHSLLFFVVFYAQVSDIVPQIDSTAEATTRPSVFNVVAFWVVALVTTAFSSVNERELRRRKADVEALAEMAASLEPRNQPDEVAAELLRAVCSTFDLARGAVAGGPGGKVELLAYHGPGETPVVGPCTNGLVRRVIDGRAQVLAKTIDGDDEWLNRVLPFARNLVAVPLSADGKAVGALVVEYGGRRGGRVERRVVSMLGQFAAHAALALKNSWLLQQVQKLAETDGLTGLANRRTFEATLEREISRAARSGEPVTLVMVDVDHFKKLNDTHGHQVGDEVLELVADVLASACRDFDTAARYGGEEFAVILPACSSAESLVVAERLRESIAEIETVADVTASAGVATFPAHAADPEGLIKAADEALYESKRTGRNRVTRSRRRGSRKSKLVILPE
ncbi:MAG TPA: sensor domain-containing diguanylate cyclase [Actinomycetota bacterium]|nr:sensor domain-containing diguanylate cyclase [Actinomycetota bacterium]